MGALACAVVVAGCGLRNPDAATSPAAASATSTPATTVGAPPAALTRAEINRQDHPPAALVRSQQAAAAARPMLPALPITTSGVTIAVAGLDPDGRTTILALTTRRGRAHALAVYRQQLRRYGDSGRAYRPEVQR